jgi:MFS family permease
MMASSAPRPGRQAWLVVGLLCLLYALSFLDRLALALVVDPVRRSLDVGDTQISLLFGIGFVGVYVLVGFPIAVLVDRGRRKPLLVGAVLLWSLATCLSAFAQHYATLMLFRSGVAIGEAVLMPVAMSLIADLFPKDRRTAPTALFTLTGPAMAAGSYILGGAALHVAEALQPILHSDAWRILFVLVAAPGPVLAALFALLTREPARRKEKPERQVDGDPLASRLWAGADICLPVFLAVGFTFTLSLGLNAWGPTLLSREHGLPPATAALLFGSVSILGAALAMVGLTPAIGVLGRGDRISGVLRVALLVTAVTLPVSALLLGAQGSGPVLAGVVCEVLCGIAASAFGPILIQLTTPAGAQGRVSAIYLLIINFLGLGLGPSLTAALSQRLAPGGRLGEALSLIAWGAAGLALLGYGVALWRHRRPRAPGGRLIATAP